MSKLSIETVLNCPSLPSLPAVAAKLIELTGDPDVAMSEIASTVQQDQALSGKVLKTVNSSYYGLPKKCGSIDRAMGYLGLNTVKSLVLGFSLVESTKNTDHEGFDMVDHWRRTLMGATASRLLADHFRLSDKDEVFTAALFQDMGTLAIYTAIKDQYIQLIPDTDHSKLSEYEMEVFGFTHAKVGSELARKWSLPENIAEAIEYHHAPDVSNGDDIEMVRAVSLGTQVAEALSADSPSVAMRRIESTIAHWFPGKVIDLQELFEGVNESAKELASLFNTEIGDLKDVQWLMSQAQERGLEHQISMQRQTETLERQALTDGLTGIGNRKDFDTRITAAFEEFQEYGTPLSVLFFDADRFKSINDTHGHGVGDAVLIELAARASEVISDRGSVFRYGGEEFVVILPSCATVDAAMLAERVRSRIDSEPFDLRNCGEGPDEIDVSVSIGVSGVDAGDLERLTKPEQIVAEADAGVYAAKHAGRNNVQVWKPSVSNAGSEGIGSSDQAIAIPVIPEGDGTIKSIMLVEDDALAATLVMTLLSRACDVDVCWIKDGNQARDYLKRTVARSERPCDLIVCDLGLPGCSGEEVFAEYIALGLLGSIPFYVLTGCVRDSHETTSNLDGLTGYISKNDFTSNISKWIRVLTESSAITPDQASTQSTNTAA